MLSENITDPRPISVILSATLSLELLVKTWNVKRIACRVTSLLVEGGEP